MTVYRICSRRYPANDGTGASLYGGRWNHEGTPVIYPASSIALCALEVMVNSDELAGDYCVIAADIPNEIAVTTWKVSDLPAGWNAPQATQVSRDIGTSWARNRSISIPGCRKTN